MNTPQRPAGEIVFCMLLASFSLFLVWQAYRISGFESLSSAGAFPMFAAAVMLISALLALRQSLRRQPTPRQSGETLAGQFVREVTPMQLISFTATLAVYMYLLDLLGFLLASYLFLNVSMSLLGSRRWGLNLLVSALSLAGIYLIFQLAFSVVLPKGRWLMGWLA